MHINRAVFLIALFGGISSYAFADATQTMAGEDSELAPIDRPWACHTAAGAGERKQHVINGILPQMVFDGETEAVDIETRMASSRVPALSVAVLHEGRLDWNGAWGRLAATGPETDCDTLFQAGSIAKPVTLLATLRMQSAGLIDLDENIETYLSSYQLPPGQQTAANPVTFRNLLAHTAGITRGGYAGYAQGEAIPTDQQIAAGEAPSNSRPVQVVNAPGSSLAYSGGAYTVVEIALQDQLQQPFDRIVDDWLFSPLGMSQATLRMPLPESSQANAARGHLIDGAMVAGGWNNYPEQAAAGLWATASDLALLMLEMHKAYRGESEVITQATITEMLANPIANHAYGFRLMGDGDQLFITHYGGTLGYSAGITVNLRTGDGAVFLTNSSNGPNLGEEFFSAVSRAYDWPVFRERRVTRVTQPDQVLQSIAGSYEFPDQGWTVMVTHEADSLRLTFPAGNRLPLVLVPIEDGELRFAHESGVIANFTGEGEDRKIHLFGQNGQRQPESE